MQPPQSRGKGGGDEPASLEALVRAQIEQTARLTALVERLVTSQASTDGQHLVKEFAEVVRTANARRGEESTALAAAVSQLAPARLTEEQLGLLADYEVLRTELGRTQANGLVGLAWQPPGTLRVTGTGLPSSITVVVNGKVHDAEVVSVDVHGEVKVTVLAVSDLRLPAHRRFEVEIRSGDRPVRRGVLVVPASNARSRPSA
ncbi:hypothetical protein ACG83_31135 [Frankia sp. R43]|uniref:hypothetical protein n=1 Tax=Frankia sp. R43 TaxID=269536 RepID=UPI0006CA0585|nr:hypothetical protein [Frankia sp. R43]KPM52013.1 hypothetical protein ACG83_31135 [Frankia sp. R43]